MLCEGISYVCIKLIICVEHFEWRAKQGVHFNDELSHITVYIGGRIKGENVKGTFM